MHKIINPTKYFARLIFLGQHHPSLFAFHLLPTVFFTPTTMCIISNDTTHHSPKATLSLSFESYENLPIAPLCERRISDKVSAALLNNDENIHALFCAPLALESSVRSSMAKKSDPVKLTLKPSRGAERLVRKALHRLSSNANTTSTTLQWPTTPTAVSGNASHEEQPTVTAPVQTTTVLAERLSRLMALQKEGEGASATTSRRAKGIRKSESMKAEKRDTASPVPLARGIRRSRSGAAALCA